MQYQLCRHIKTNGTRCHAPSLTGTVWCYFHDRLHQQHATYHYAPAARGYLVPGQHIQLAPLEDRESVQVAISVVINALAIGKLETRRATALLYGLQLASSNARGLDLQPSVPEIVRAVETTDDGIDLAEPVTQLELLDGQFIEDDQQEDDEEDDGKQYYDDAKEEQEDEKESE